MVLQEVFVAAEKINTKGGEVMTGSKLFNDAYLYCHICGTSFKLKELQNGKNCPWCLELYISPREKYGLPEQDTELW